MRTRATSSYKCRETPEKGDIRVFRTGMARWGGTSAADARNNVLARAVYDSDPTVGPHVELQQPYA